jgi:small basic protein
VKEAGLSVSGAAGIAAKLSATAQPNKAISGFSPPLGMDLAFSVPVGVFFGVPLNMVVTQRFTVQVNIPGQTHLDAVGKLKLGSTLGFSYSNGTFANTTSASLDSSASLNATNSIAVGISWASFDYNVKFTIGLGYLGFVAGVYLALAAHVLVAVGAPIGFNPAQGAQDPIEHCKSVQGSLWVDYGVGYSIPSPVAKLVNYFLTAFQSAPIQTSGGLSKGWVPVLNRYEVFPQSGFCVKK